MKSTRSPHHAVRCVLRALVLTALVTTSSAFAETHKLQVSDPAVAREVAAKGGRLIADYGSYQLYEMNRATPELDGLRGVENRDRFNHIELNAGDIDTTLPATKALRTPVGQFTGRQMHMIQFAGPVQPAWVDALLKTGVKIVDYVPNNTYIVYGDAAALSQLQSWAAASPVVQWDGAYEKGHKVHPRARTVDSNGQPQTIGTDYFTIQLEDDPTANAATLALIDQLRLAPVLRQSRVLHFVNITIQLNPANIDAIAAQPDVVSIHPYFVPHKMDERQDQIVAGNLTVNSPTGPGYLAWLASKGFTQAQFDAADFVVDLSDSGVDNGTNTPNHFGLYVSGVRPGTSRIVYNRLEGTANSGSTLQGCDGHGNINCHIIGGYDDLTGFPYADSSGFHYGLGVCPFVKIGSSVIFDPSNFTNPNYSNLTARAYRDKARLSSNSWGADTAGAYDSDAQQYDVLVRDAQPAGSVVPTTGNQEMVFVFAAGNAGSATKTVGSPGTAKNVITVGAAENVQAFGGNDGCAIGDTGADSANDIISFSSRGPCSDGRKKPEIVAPGTHISGGVAQTSNPGTLGTANSCFNSNGVCGGVTSGFFPSGQQFYTASSGTSHSTPAVAGGCALIRQYFINNFSGPPSPAMTKAYLMNSARYMTGTSANDTLWSNNQGMGEMNLGMAFDGVPRFLRDEVTSDLFTNSGATRVFTGSIADSSKPFRVTIAWTDAPGSTSGNAYKNNLDLTVIVGASTYKGNVFSGQYSTTGGSADVADNAESVFLPAGTSGSYTVTVAATSINSDGVPNNSYSLDQDFALVVYNGTQAFSPQIVANGSTLTAESCTPTNGMIDPNETVTISFSIKNVGTTNTVNLVATLLATNGVTLPGSPQTYGNIAPSAVATQPFSFTATGACGGSIRATLQLQDGTTNYGTITYTLPLGQVLTQLSQNFDGVAAPALPSGWTTAASGTQSNWVTSTASYDTASNAAYTPDSQGVGVSELDSPTFAIGSSAAQLTFRQNYSLTASTTNPAIGYDGGVLEIKIGSGSYTDILAAGGSFASGGYNTTLSSSYSNPLAGRQAWSGNSGAFIPTVVNLPASAAGQNVQLRWRCGTGSVPVAPFDVTPLSTSGTLAFWSFDSSTATPDTVGQHLSVSSVTVSNVGGSLTFAAGASGEAVASSGFTTSAGPPTTSYSHFAFSITASNGYQVGLSSLSLSVRRSNTGPTNFTIQASQQANFSSVIYDSGVKTATSSFATTTLTLTNSSLTGTVYFRIYAYKAGGSGGTFRVDNLNVQGTVDTSGPGGWYIDTVSVTDPVCCSASVNQPPVINAANVSPSSPTTTNELLAVVASASDPDNDPIAFAYQWQQSTNNSMFADLSGQTAINLAAAVTIAGDYYRVVITPNDGTTNGAPFTTTSVAVLVDADGNGINDDWEVQYFSHIGVDPNADADADGMSNLQEYLAGTDPTNPTSVFHITSIINSGPNVVVNFTSATNRTYDLQNTDSLQPTNWNPVVTGIAGTGTISSGTDPGAAGVTNRFYRVRLVP